MGIEQDIGDLREASRIPKKETKLGTLRNILKILVVGFFIGRDIDRRIQEAKNRRDVAANRKEYFGNVENLLKQLDEMRKIDAFTARTSRKDLLATLISNHNESIWGREKVRVIRFDFGS